jgi:hypothetical protein
MARISILSLSVLSVVKFSALILTGADFTPPELRSYYFTSRILIERKLTTLP